METILICCKCGETKLMKENVLAFKSFPNKLVKDSNGYPIKCDNCFDNDMIIQNKDIIDLLCKEKIKNREIIKKSNDIFIRNTIIEQLAILNKELTKSEPNETTIIRTNNNIKYWESTQIINSKL